jgi:hypothetical protein
MSEGAWLPEATTLAMVANLFREKGEPPASPADFALFDGGNRRKPVKEHVSVLADILGIKRPKKVETEGKT